MWELYQAAYGEIATTDITREMLYRSEFDEVMADPTYRTTIVRDDAGQPVAMSTFATDIGATRYLSRPYFELRYPQRLASGRIHYVMWIVVSPEFKGRRATWDLARAALAAEAEEGTLLVFDLPESNQPNERGGGAEFFHRVASTIGDVGLESFGASRYYALDFAASEADTPASESERVTT
jgi:hypothetical protein